KRGSVNHLRYYGRTNARRFCIRDRGNFSLLLARRWELCRCSVPRSGVGLDRHADQSSRRRGPMKKKVRVLIVDDEPALRDVITSRLEHSGYECRAVGSVGEAESSLEEFDPDLVLSDVVMPGA